MVSPVLGQSLLGVFSSDGNMAGVDCEPHTFQSEDLVHNECLVLVDPASEFPFDLHDIHSFIPHGLHMSQELINPVLGVAVFYPVVLCSFRTLALMPKHTSLSCFSRLLTISHKHWGSPG